MRPVVNYLGDGNLNTYHLAKPGTQTTNSRPRHSAAFIELDVALVEKEGASADTLIPKAFLEEMEVNGVLRGRNPPHSLSVWMSTLNAALDLLAYRSWRFSGSGRGRQI